MTRYETPRSYTLISKAVTSFCLIVGFLAGLLLNRLFPDAELAVAVGWCTMLGFSIIFYVRQAWRAMGEEIDVRLDAERRGESQR